MRTYTLHLPKGIDPGAPEALERATLVPDGFSWAAFAFSALWFFWHRLWLAGLAVLVGVAIVWGIGLALPLDSTAGALVALLIASLVGLEASSLRRWTYARAGRPVVDLVAAPSRDEAERCLIARRAAIAANPDLGLYPGPDLAPGTVGPARSSAPSYRGSGRDAVIGLFPEAERRP